MVRGGVQLAYMQIDYYLSLIQFPWCVGEFNVAENIFTYDEEISIPVVRGGVQLKSFDTRGLAQVISIPVVRGGVQQELFGAGTKSQYISIPVVRGGVQQMLEEKFLEVQEFQFPWCVGEFNYASARVFASPRNFNSRGAWGSSTFLFERQIKEQLISIPVVRGGVQPSSLCENS